VIETVVIVLLAAVALGAGWLAVRALTRKADAEFDREADRLRLLAELPIAEAAERARAILREGHRVAGSEAPDATSLPDMAPEVRALFLKYEIIRSVPDGDIVIDRALAGPSTLKPGYVRIGRVASGTDAEGELCVRPGGEEVFEIYGGEEPDPVYGTYRSVHHLIVAVAGEADDRAGHDEATEGERT
jgi:hypothetical protein